MIIGVPKEADAGETRAAMTPANASRLVALGATVQIETGATGGSGFPDDAFASAGVSFVDDRQKLLEVADIILRVRKPPIEEVAWMKAGAIQISFLDPFKETELVAKLATSRISAFSLEMLP